MTLDPILARSLLAFAVGLTLIALGILLDPVLALLDRITPLRV